MARVDDLMREVRQGLKECPDPAMLSALQRACAAFCRETHIWQDQLEPFVLVDGEANYEFDAPTDARVEKVLSARIDNSELKPAMNRADLHRIGADTRGIPRAFAMIGDGDGIQVWPIPDDRGAGLLVSLFVVLAPVRSAREIPDFLADEWNSAIVSKARSELMMVAGTPYHNPDAAQYERATYLERVGDAKRQQISGHHGLTRLRPRAWV